MFDQDRKKAVEERAKALAAEYEVALTDDQEARVLRELRACLRELRDDFNSVKLVYEYRPIFDIIKESSTAEWNHEIERLFDHIQMLCVEVEESGDWKRCGQIYEMIEGIIERFEL